MPSAKRANSIARHSAGSLAAAALAFVLGLGPARADTKALPPAPLAPAQQYDQCLALAHAEPQRAYDEATAWHDLGGGFPAQHCAAVALVGMKKYPEAATQLQSLAGAMMQADKPLRGQTLDQAGQVWLLANKPNEAKADFDAALAFEPKDPDVLIDRAEAYAMGGKYFEAIDDLNSVLDIAPNRADALIYRASAYRQLDSLDLALDDVERALVLEPDAVPGLLERGNIRRIKGDIAGAQADWQRILALAPASSEARSAKANLAHLADRTPPQHQLETTAPAKP